MSPPQHVSPSTQQPDPQHVPLIPQSTHPQPTQKLNPPQDEQGGLHGCVHDPPTQ